MGCVIKGGFLVHAKKKVGFWSSTLCIVMHVVIISLLPARDISNAADDVSTAVPPVMPARHFVRVAAACWCGQTVYRYTV